MQIALELPTDLGARLEAIAAAQGTTVAAVLINGAALVVAQHERTVEVLGILDEVAAQDAELLRRLGDA
jgi:hypothetical protein